MQYKLKFEIWLFGACFFFECVHYTKLSFTETYDASWWDHLDAYLIAAILDTYLKMLS